MALIGLIPARGGSKGIARKNIALCAGRPLIAWTCEAAMASRELAATLLSTDSAEIASIAREWGVDAPFMRPEELALDTTPSLDVMVHALDWLESRGRHVTALVLLQPTSPLRTAAHIDGALQDFVRSGADTLVSVVEVPHRFHPDVVLAENDGWLSPRHGASHKVARRQDMAPLFARNGPAILVTTPAVLRSGRLYGERVRAYRMEAIDSIDIDTTADLYMASALLEARTNKAASARPTAS
jgi:CMP-N,N'-diacetyllegionaminic acid synthase